MVKAPISSGEKYVAILETELNHIMSFHNILEIDEIANPENDEYSNTVDSALLGHIGRILFYPNKAVLPIIRNK